MSELRESILFLLGGLFVAAVIFVFGASTIYTDYLEGKEIYCQQRYTLYKQVTECESKPYPWEK